MLVLLFFGASENFSLNQPTGLNRSLMCNVSLCVCSVYHFLFTNGWKLSPRKKIICWSSALIVEISRSRSAAPTYGALLAGPPTDPLTLTFVSPSAHVLLPFRSSSALNLETWNFLNLIVFNWFQPISAVFKCLKKKWFSAFEKYVFNCFLIVLNHFHLFSTMFKRSNNFQPFLAISHSFQPQPF